MFVLTTLVYPVVLALLCTGTGLLVDRASASILPGMLLPVVGAAALIVVSQLSTYAAPLAPVTPYLMMAAAIAGFALGWPRLSPLSRAWRATLWQAMVGPLAYVLALAPVLLAGRPTFSSYLALADSAVHMLGADFLIRHGQDYSHLDLRNSYGETIKAYYGASYPSGADTLLGGSSFLLRLPVIWTFQPFAAFMLATATGPAWMLARRLGLQRAWATLATLTIALPALVYAYELVGSVKEIVALPLILTMGSLVVMHGRWLWAGARSAIPFALLAAAGIATLGAAFGAWALAATLVLAATAASGIARGKQSARGLLALTAVGAVVLLVAALPTWIDISGSVRVAQAIASTANPGNLHTPLHSSQVLGVWLAGSYKLSPHGVALTLTSVLLGLALTLAVVGLGYVVRSGRYALAGWFALTIVLWALLASYATTWAEAKTLMLTSPAVLLMAWAGIAALRASPLRIAAPLVAFLLVGGVVASDALQYHQSNLAPTARYEELASLNRRFAGRGPVLFSDFDEYALYELRDLDISGPDFASVPASLVGAAKGYGQPVAVDRIAPAGLSAYPLILTRRDPSAVRPPAAYRLLWRGVYYEMWGRSPTAGEALAHLALSGSLRARCAQVARVGRASRSGARELVGSLPPELVSLRLARIVRPRGWGLVREGIVMGPAGTLHAAFRLPHAGRWGLWLKGEVMRAMRIAIDGRPLGSLGAQLGGNSLVPNTLTPVYAQLSAGPHSLAIARSGVSLAPGDGGSAVLAAIFLVPAGRGEQSSLHRASVSQTRSLCGRPFQWVELVSYR